MKHADSVKIRTLVTSIILCVMYSLGGVNAQPTFSIDGSLSGSCYSIEILESSRDCYKIHGRIHRINNMNKMMSDTLYHLLYFDVPVAKGKFGCPAFPTISQIVAIPEGHSFQTSLTEDVWEDIYIGNIFPVQQPRYEDDSTVVVFNKSSYVYNSTSYAPEIISTSDEMTYRDVRNVAFKICPFKYSPLTGIVAVLKEFTLQINFTRTREFNPTLIKHSLTSALFSNGNILPSEAQDNNSLGGSRSFPAYEYLIIVGDIEGAITSSCISRFRKWKAYKGLNSKMVSTSEIGSTADDIKSYITNEYQHNPYLKYVLLIGDVDKIPMKRLASPSPMRSITFGGVYHVRLDVDGDYWYGCMDEENDFLADIAIGRFPTNDTLELSNMIDKTIRYEDMPNTFNSDVLLVAAQDDSVQSFIPCAEQIRTEQYNSVVVMDTIYGSSREPWYLNPRNEDIVDAINDGVNIVNYRGHGGEKDWSSWSNLSYFFDYEVDSLDNEVNSPFFSIACWTGNIAHTQPCMLETFLRSNHGAVSFLGATCRSFHVANQTFNPLLFTCLYNDGIMNIGELINAAHFRNMQSFDIDSTSYDNALIYICGGDPSLEIWTGQPQVFNNLTFTPTSDGQLMLNTNMTEDVLVHVVSEYGEKFWTVPISSSGILPSYGNVCYYAINRHNYIPYILRVDFTSNTIQNMTFTDNNLYMATPISICSPTIVKEGSSLQLNMNNGVTINDGFSVEKGGQLLIK